MNKEPQFLIHVFKPFEALHNWVLIISASSLPEDVWANSVCVCLPFFSLRGKNTEEHLSKWTHEAAYLHHIKNKYITRTFNTHTTVHVLHFRSISPTRILKFLVGQGWLIIAMLEITWITFYEGSPNLEVRDRWDQTSCTILLTA